MTRNVKEAFKWTKNYKILGSDNIHGEVLKLITTPGHNSVIIQQILNNYNNKIRAEIF